jgi:hypothetical protein
MADKIVGKGQVAAEAKQLIAGVAKHLGATTQVVILGSSLTPAEITTKLQSIVTLRSDVDAAKASTKAKLAAEKADMPALRTFMRALSSYVKAAYGSQPDVLADFGILPKARVQATVEGKAGAVAKRKATRAARHTMGTRQKHGVKGDVTGVTLTPVHAAPPSVTPPASPAAPATSGGGQVGPPPASPATSGGTPATPPHAS